MQEFDVAIVGAGGAGLTAAIYTARARRRVLVLEGRVTGGQIATTDAVENYPGFPDGVNGFDLAQSFLRQAERFGAELMYEEVESLDHMSGGLFRLRTASEEISARAVIVTTGAAHNRLGVPGEDDFAGRGVSWCATCDAAFFADQDVVVVGGGDAALDEGLFLSRYVRSVQMIHRRDSFRGSKILQERALKNPKVSVTWNTVLEGIEGNEAGVTAVRLRNVIDGSAETRPVSGVFVFIGQTPTNRLLKGLTELDAGGHAVVDLHMRTKIPGLFVAGDVRTGAARQLVAACGDGATAAISAEHFLQASGE